jgi:hypothetical protein
MLVAFGSATCPTRSYKLALWHEGVVGNATDPTIFRTYAQQMAQFVIDRCFDRVFILLMDPTQFAYASISNAVYFLSLVPPPIEVAILLYVNPKDSEWGFNKTVTGTVCS